MKKLIILSCAVLMLIAGYVYSSPGRVERYLAVAKFWNGSSFQYPRVDASTDAVQTIIYAHHEVHNGSHYIFQEILRDVDTGVTRLVAIAAPDSAKQAHLLWSASSNKALQVEVYQETTASSVIAGKGAARTPINSNRNSTNTSDCVLSLLPTSYIVGGASTMLLNGYSGTAGKNAAKPGLAGAQRGDDEIILKSGATTFIHMTSLEDDGYITVSLTWYEHTPHN